MQDWRIRKHYGAEKLLHSYLAYRVRNETDPLVGKYVEIRQVATELCSHTEADYEATLDALCWLALERVDHMPGYRQYWMRNIRDSHRCDESNPGLNLLSAAAHFGYMPLAKQLLQNGHCPTSTNQLFPSPIFLAAFAGNVDMLKLFQEYLPEFKDEDYLHEQWEGIKGAL